MKNILLLGGDIRIRILKERFEKSGFSVKTRGVFDGDEGRIEAAQLIVLPIPLSRDGIYLSCPLTRRFIELEEIVQKAEERPVFGGGRLEGIKNYTDYSALDEYALLNAVPTAEGAIAAAVSATPFTLHGSKILQIGFGRVGKVLAPRLMGLGGRLTVAARKPEAEALIKISGANFAEIKDLSSLRDFDIIFNTVDAPLLEGCTQLIKNTLIIDLSTSGCLGAEAAAREYVKYMKLPGLPGKTAPQTAADILYGIITRKGELL